MNRLSIAVIAPFALASLLLACPSSETDSGSSGPASSGATPSELDPDAFEFDRVTDLDGDGDKPEQLAAVGEHLFFTAVDPDGRGLNPSDILYISDGTESGTKALEPTGGVDDLIDVDGQIFLTDRGRLWKVDTRAQERVHVAVARHDGRDGSVHLDPKHLVAFDGRLVFSADARESEGPHAVGRELWISDGTSAGTRLLKNINPDGDSNPGVSVTRDEGVTEAGGVLYCVAEHEDYGKELWTTDGTEEGTRLVKNISSERGSAPHAITELDGEVYFGAAEEFTLYDLWGSDGTEDGTRKVKAIYASEREELWGAYPTNFMRYDGRLFFNAQPTGNSIDSEMWVTDGTEAGTGRVHEVAPTGHYALLDGCSIFAAAIRRPEASYGSQTARAPARGL